MKISGSRMEQGLKLHRKGTQGNSVAIALKDRDDFSFHQHLLKPAR